MKNVFTKKQIAYLEDMFDDKLKNFVTKEYLDDKLKNFVTKEYLDDKFDEKLTPINDSINRIEKILLSKM